MNEQAQNPSH